AEALAAGRVAFDLDGASFPEAVERLLAGELADRPALMRRVAADLARTAEEASSEPAPGVVFTAHVTEEIREPLLFLGIAGEGIPVPGASAPARLLFLLLLPPRCAHERLRYLSEVARLVRTEERREQLCRCRTPDTLFDWFRPDPAPGAPEEAEPPRTPDEAAGVEPAPV
ncbi:MAG TPA: PTS sugar transporter subunit IIA, partial [Longimicrobiaceae bacterium]|nr:PTS sugar transporter subunit IIA [Longimicrobiaceae bacterium]